MELYNGCEENYQLNAKHSKKIFSCKLINDAGVYLLFEFKKYVVAAIVVKAHKVIPICSSSIKCIVISINELKLTAHTMRGAFNSPRSLHVQTC